MRKHLGQTQPLTLAQSSEITAMRGAVRAQISKSPERADVKGQVSANYNGLAGDLVTFDHYENLSQISRF